MSWEKDFYELDQFLGYFNQDWVLIFSWQNEEPTFQAVARYFKVHNSRQIVQKLTDEIDAFLNLPLTEYEFNKTMVEAFGCSFTPRSQGLNKRQFLEKSLEIFKESIEKTKTHFIPEFIG